MSSSLGFFTLAQKQGVAEDCEAIGKLKHVLTKEYSALKQQHNDSADLVSNKFYKLEAPESSFAEVLHVFAKDNSVTSSDIVSALHSGSILIPQMDVVTNDTDESSALPQNWQIRFLYHQLADFFQHQHSTACHTCLKALRMMQMRSPDEEARYFAASDRAFQHWKLKGTEPLHQPDGIQDHTKQQQPQKQQNEKTTTMTTEMVSPKGCSGTSMLEVLDRLLTPTPIQPKKEESVTDTATDEDDKSVWSVDSIVESVEELLTPVPEASDRFEHGILLFTDVNNSTHHFQPNFLPPYNGKHKIILDVLQTRTGKLKAIRKLAKASSLPGVIQCDHRLTQYSSEEDSSAKLSSKRSGKSANSVSKRGGKLRSKFTKLFQPPKATAVPAK